MKDYRDKVAVITGAGRGIGRGIALHCAKEGMKVVLAGFGMESLTKTAADLEALGAETLIVQTDVSQVEQVENLAAATVEAFGQVDLLVNNASLFEYDDLASLDPERYLRHQAINALAPLLLSREFASQAPESGAAVVNILDQKLSNPNPDYLSYTASKQALGGLTSALAQQLAPNVRVNGVAPGLTLPSAHASAEAFAEVHGSNPLARGVRPEDIAEAVIYLARAAAITGVVLHVDGGEHLAPRSDDVLYGKG